MSMPDDLKRITISCTSPSDAAVVAYRSGLLLAASSYRWVTEPAPWLEEKRVALVMNAYRIYGLPIRFVIGDDLPHFNGGTALPIHLNGR